MGKWTTVTLLALVVIAGCSSDNSASDESEQLEAELVASQSELDNTVEQLEEASTLNTALEDEIVSLESELSDTVSQNRQLEVTLDGWKAFAGTGHDEVNQWTTEYFDLRIARCVDGGPSESECMCYFTELEEFVPLMDMMYLELWFGLVDDGVSAEDLPRLSPKANTGLFRATEACPLSGSSG